MDIVGGLTASLIETLPLVPAAVGFYIALRCLKFPDLTVEGSFVIGLVSTAFFINKFDSGVLSIVVSIISGAVLGATTGILHVRLRVPSFASGIITSFFATTLNYFILQHAFDKTETVQEENIYGRGVFTAPYLLDSSLGRIGQYWPYSIFSLFVVCFFVIVVVWIAIRSWLGRTASMFGNNREASKIYSNRSELYIITGLAFTNSLVSLSGSIYAQINIHVNIGYGTAILIPLLASVVIGEFFVSVFRFRKKNIATPLLSRPFHLAFAPVAGFLTYNVIVLLFSAIVLPNIEFADNYYKHAIIGLVILAIMIIKRSQNRGVSNPEELI